MTKISAFSLLVVGLIHLAPVVGVAGPHVLARLYDVHPSDLDVLLLLQHRAVLFGLLGAFSLGACWFTEWRPAAYVSGAVSLISFLVLLPKGANPALVRLARIDTVALVVLVIGAIAELLQRNG